MKDKNEIKQQVLYVKMFGDFAVEYQGKSIIGKKKKETQFAQVLQLLFHSRQEGVSLEYMEKVLFGDRMLNDADHAVHSLIYNTRRKLEQSGLPKGKYIISRKGKFYWDDEIPYEEDARSFELCCQEACRAESWEEQMEALWNAIYLYKGCFLENSQQGGWVQEERERYREMFRELVEAAAGILREKKAYMQLEQLGRHAAKVTPYEQRELLVIEALTGMGKKELAQDIYKDTIRRYQEVYPQEQNGKLIEFRQKIEEQLDHPYDILDNIQESMTEHMEQIKGPYQCSWEVFREIYHMVSRMMERGGQKVLLMLCTLTDMEKYPIVSDRDKDMLSRYMMESICRSIRSGDAVTRYGKGQYLVLLIGAGEEDYKGIQERISENFRKNHTVYEIQYSVKPVRSRNNTKEDWREESKESVAARCLRG